MDAGASGLNFSALEHNFAALNSPNNEVLPSFKERLLRPDDFVVKYKHDAENYFSTCALTSQSQCFDKITDMQSSFNECLKPSLTALTSQHSDSGISTPDEAQNSEVDMLHKVYSMSKDCESFTSFVERIKDVISVKACDSFLSLLVSFSLCGDAQHQCHVCSLAKLISAQNHEVSLTKSPSSQAIPIAVFWDIENCQVPSGKSAFGIVQKIRKSYFSGYHETEFMAVCDINKETKQVVQDLNNAQVNVVHVNATAKNAADDKLRQSIRRFAHSFTAPAKIILITGDCNFTAEVSDLRHRHNFFVLLMHNVITSDCLKQAAHSAVLYEDFVKDLPIVYPYLPSNTPSRYHLHVSRLPCDEDIRGIRYLLKQLSSNCGGKVLNVTPPFATLRFTSQELANRAMKRLNDEEIFGSKILVERYGKMTLPSFIPQRKTPVTQAPSAPATSNSRTRRKPSNGGKVQNSESKKNSKPVEAKERVSISITNIDAQLGNEAITNSISKFISQHCEVSQLHILPYNRFTVTCAVTLPSKHHALAVLENLHRKRLGSKRILAMIPAPSHFSINLFKVEIIPLLKQYDDIGCPFCELAASYHHTYHKILKVSNLQLLSDIVLLEDASNGLMVHPKPANIRKATFICKTHHKRHKKGDVDDVIISIGLSEFSSRLHILLHSHDGLLYMDCLQECYEAEFGSFPLAKTPDEGVLLEHELSYVPGIVVVSGKVRIITWMARKNDPGVELLSTSRSMTSQMMRFTNQLIEVLKTRPHSCASIEDFKLVYEQIFGDCLQYTNQVLDVLASMPHVVQIIGKPGKELVVLSHRTQVKQFTSELVKILKCQPDKKVSTCQLPLVYERIIARKWNVHNFGVNSLVDLLDDIPDATVNVTDDVISLPSMERTNEEMARTAQFSSELIDLLKHRPQHRIVFKDFIPAYHRQYGRQCRLAKFGFNKLSDLFESMPHIVEVVEMCNEKYLQLSKEERLKALASQLLSLLSESDAGIPLLRLQSIYTRKYARPLTPRDYDCESIEALITSLPHVIQVTVGEGGTRMVVQSERRPIRLLTVQLLVLLLDIDHQQLELQQLHRAYVARYREEIDAGRYGFTSLESVARKALSGIAKVELNGASCMILLKPIYERAKRIRNVLLRNSGTMTLGEFNRSYRDKFNESVGAERFGFPSCEMLLRALPLVVAVKGFGIKKTVSLRNHMHYGPLSSSVGGKQPPTTPLLHPPTTPLLLLPTTPLLPTVADVEHIRASTRPFRLFNSWIPYVPGTLASSANMLHSSNTPQTGFVPKLAMFSSPEQTRGEYFCPSNGPSPGFPPAPAILQPTHFKFHPKIARDRLRGADDLYVSYQHYRQLQHLAIYPAPM